MRDYDYTGKEMHAMRKYLFRTNTNNYRNDVLYVRLMYAFLCAFAFGVTYSFVAGKTNAAMLCTVGFILSLVIAFKTAYTVDKKAQSAMRSQDLRARTIVP